VHDPASVILTQDVWTIHIARSRTIGADRVRADHVRCQAATETYRPARVPRCLFLRDPRSRSSCPNAEEKGGQCPQLRSGQRGRDAGHRGAGVGSFECGVSTRSAARPCPREALATSRRVRLRACVSFATTKARGPCRGSGASSFRSRVRASRRLTRDGPRHGRREHPYTPACSGSGPRSSTRRWSPEPRRQTMSPSRRSSACPASPPVALSSLVP